MGFYPINGKPLRAGFTVSIIAFHGIEKARKESLTTPGSIT
jgi:hypothetical protein